MEKRRRLRLKRWPTEDWEYAHPTYRFIKATFHHPVVAAARLRVKGQEHIPDTGGLILAVNHYSWADPVLVSAVLHRPTFYLAKEAVFGNAFGRALMEATGQIKVNRDTGGNEDAVATALDILAHGLVVGIFPEGTRARPGEVKRGRTGVARIAALSGCPVIPIGIDTTTFWPRGRALPKFGDKVYVNVGEPMRLELTPADSEDKKRMRDATDDIMARVAALLAEAMEAKRARRPWP